jgi:hypothetical protein
VPGAVARAFADDEIFPPVRRQLFVLYSVKEV